LILTICQGRPLRVRNNPYIQNWEENRSEQIRELTGKGKIPVEYDMETLGDDIDDDTLDNARPFLMGKVAAVVNEKKSAKAIVDEMIDGAVSSLQTTNSYIVSSTKL
jgi:NAD(P)H-dependent flavin oxidoreductase YrpB (nitropropane dioxygenase family)